MQEELQAQQIDQQTNENNETEQHFKTLAVRVEEDLHTQLRFIAQLNGSSLAEEIRRAIEHRVTTAQQDPDLISRAQAAREEIEREAAARAAAIAGFIGKPAIRTVVNQSKVASTRTTTKPGGE